MATERLMPHFFTTLAPHSHTFWAGMATLLVSGHAIGAVSGSKIWRGEWPTTS